MGFRCSSFDGIQVIVFKSTRVRYYLIVASLSLFFVYIALSISTQDISTWSLLVVLRFLFIAAADTLGEGLMILIRRLEENAKEFFDEVDTISIVGTYITFRGLSRAICSTIGAYAAGSLGARTMYLVAAVAPLAIAIVAKETFHEVGEGEADFLDITQEGEIE